MLSAAFEFVIALVVTYSVVTTLTKKKRKVRAVKVHFSNDHLHNDDDDGGGSEYDVYNIFHNVTLVVVSVGRPYFCVIESN